MSEEKQNKVEKLTVKEKKFVEAYLGEAHFNGTEAARLAGYKGSKNTLGVVAYENLRKPKIKAEIDMVLSAMTMPANVVLTRLTEIADANIEDVCDAEGNFDFKLAKQRGKTHLVKSLQRERTIRQKKTEVREDMRSFLADDEVADIETEVEIIHEKVKFELHDAHGALRDLGKHHKLFTDKTEVETTVNLPEQLASSLEKALLKAYGGESDDK